jgi:tRNA G37 N-methylase TrmD
MWWRSWNDNEDRTNIAAIQELKKENTIVAITTPKGHKIEQKISKNFQAKRFTYDHPMCRYEGFDQRIHEHWLIMNFP